MTDLQTLTNYFMLKLEDAGLSDKFSILTLPHANQRADWLQITALENDYKPGGQDWENLRKWYVILRCQHPAIYDTLPAGVGIPQGYMRGAQVGVQLNKPISGDSSPSGYINLYLERPLKALAERIRGADPEVFGRAKSIFQKEWLTKDVADVAMTINNGRDFYDLPILADALEEAGCTNQAILASCRGDAKPEHGTHWVVNGLICALQERQAAEENEQLPDSTMTSEEGPFTEPKEPHR